MADGSCSRREFLGAIGAIAGLPCGDPTGRRATAAPVGRQSPPNQPLGIQLYTLRDPLQRDFPGTLAALAAIGYREVELWTLYGQPAGEVRRLLDHVGLRAPAGHVGLDAITDNLEQTIADARTLGHTYVIVPWLPDRLRTADGYAGVADQFNRAGERLVVAGLQLGYHNHAFEFAPLADGSIGYDILLARTDPGLVVMELDLFWIRQGGGDALDYFRRHRGRYRCVHIKDMAADGAMTDVGKGVMDWPALLAAARVAGVRHYFAEHDRAKNPLSFARNSYRYLSGLRF